ncbi:tetratricopeptide repeat protein [Paenibacillus sp. y28]|uniref:tetratricopeptide repeat protein n=1 Tax=Paenibacillus sp. y28 TaxID=3129110 RepID=UPI003018A017
MIKQCFAIMNEMLDELVSRYGSAGDEEQRDLQDQLSALKQMSDGIVEEWLLFEEKFNQVWTECQCPSVGQQPEESPAAETNAFDKSLKAENVVQSLTGSTVCEKQQGPSEQQAVSEYFIKGQGYYQLFMLEEAIELFERAVRVQPDLLLAKLYLAMSYMRKGEYAEAYGLFQLIAALNEQPAVQAVVYNAMGCIQVLNRNTEKAIDYFKEAHRFNPEYRDPLVNMEACLQSGKQTMRPH